MTDIKSKATSYGKSPELREAMARRIQLANPYQQARLLNDARPQSNKVFNPPAFTLTYIPSTGTTADEVRIIPGEYKIKIPMVDEDHRLVLDENGQPQVMELDTNYFTYRDHYSATKNRGTRCSGGPFSAFPEFREECQGCSMHEEDRVSMRQLFAYTVLIFGDFIESEQVDAHGIVKRDKRGEPYKIWKKMSQGEMHLKYRNLVGTPRHRTYDKRIWSMGLSHWNILWANHDIIGQNCKSCGSSKSIITTVWSCPTCEAPIIDMRTTLMNEEQVMRVTRNMHTCSTCGEKNFLKEELECLTCDHPSRQSIFDINLFVRRVPKPTKRNADAKELVIDGFSLPKKIPNELCVSIDGKPPVASPFDLTSILAPDSLEAQAAVYGVTTKRLQEVTKPYEKKTTTPVMNQSLLKPTRTPVETADDDEEG